MLPALRNLRFLSVLVLYLFVPAMLVAAQASPQADPTNKPAAPPVSGYFPVGVFDLSDRSLSDLIAEGFAKYLHNLGEPSLLRSEKDVTSYRLIWGGYPSEVMVRLTISHDGAASLITKVNRISRSGEVAQHTEDVSAKQVEEFLTILERSGFWSLPTAEVRTRVLDGTTWILEGSREGTYHVVYRRSPKPSEYTEVGRYLAKHLARLDDSIISIPEYP